MNPTILLTFDVEEFDLPLEFNQFISRQEQFEIGKKGIDAIAPLLRDHDISSTMFITGSFASKFPDTVRKLSETHEIASHSLNHSEFQIADLSNSRCLLKEITQCPVKGFRMPRMKKIHIEWIKQAGYSYDASINPTYLPGRYNNLLLPRKIYFDDNFLRLPCSVTPNLRIPLFWLTFKNFPYSLYKKIAIQTLKKDGYLSLYFHPWEFTEISKYKLPFYINKRSGTFLLEKLERFISDLKNIGSFKTISSFLNEYKP